ncbi:DUF2637 domain-containing protein [Streptomyces yunnanensis]|uniref:DUF2637 domain-containing protein n=1 Tax=Streptomyces yunnanensis TaxID=156453 RepID=UPI002570EAE3|nr:DUF2637 domain-containing protein [Streptomyces yunnanensis]
MTSHSTITPVIPGTAAIRAGIALLAAFAFALSYDALRQMAVAIHIRGLLTYAFPLVIDGFIAIGVGALLMLRTAPLRSRVYVWALVGVATVTSIWANALHAVRLNEQSHQDDRLRLGDLTVGALSAIAPLALAGAVHLYIVIRRHPTPRAQQADASQRHNAANRSHNSIDIAVPAALVDEGHGAQGPTAPDVADDPADVVSDTTDVTTAPQPSNEPQGHGDREIPGERLAIARTAPLGRNGRASRRHIEDTFRSRGLTIGRKEADKIKDVLQAELDEAAPQRQRETDSAPVSAA